MKFSKSLLILSLVITAIGLLTGQFFFLLLLIPVGLFGSKKKEDDSFPQERK